MIKFRKFLSFVICDDRGLIGGGGIIERIVMLGAGILVPAILIFPVRMVLPDSQIAQPISAVQEDPVVQLVQLSQRACIRMVDPVGIVLDPAAPHLNLKDPRIKILMKALYKTPPNES
jgi:hypothetical protein